jgi:hypothetical protein
VKRDFRFAGPDDPLTCLTCANWRLQDSRINGVGKCAVALAHRIAHSYSGPYATCFDFTQARPIAVAKRKELLG